jgi:competence protein ComEC
MKYLLGICLILFILRWHLPPQLLPGDFVTVGTIASLAEYQPHHLQFLFIPIDHPHQKIVLSWYAPPPVTLCAGDDWQLHIRVKPTHKNWLLSDNINAEGSVQFDLKNQLIEKHPWKYPVTHLRELIYFHLKNTLSAENHLGFISALTIGMRDNITPLEWDDLRGTGTNHLMAIAGLHIGFASGMAYFVINFLWRRFSTLMLWKPAQEAATVSALITAFLYSALSGFALPAQRAVIMLSVFLFTYLYRKKIHVWTSYFLALGMIVSLEPLSILTPTFWLSFTAVGLLIYGNSGRIGHQGFWQHAVRAQWIMALGLIPLSFLFFKQVSLTGFAANCIAIPFVGFIILPLCLAGIFCPFCWKTAGFLMAHFWPLMHTLAVFPHSQWYAEMPYPALCAAFIAIVFLLAPTGFPYRWMGLWGLLPIILRY